MTHYSIKYTFSIKTLDKMNSMNVHRTEHYPLQNEPFSILVYVFI